MNKRHKICFTKFVKFPLCIVLLLHVDALDKTTVYLKDILNLLHFNYLLLCLNKVQNEKEKKKNIKYMHQSYWPVVSQLCSRNRLNIFNVWTWLWQREPLMSAYNHTCQVILKSTNTFQSYWLNTKYYVFTFVSHYFDLRTLYAKQTNTSAKYVQINVRFLTLTFIIYIKFSGFT